MVQMESQSSDTGESFSLLGCIMGLAAQTSLRASQSVSAAFVANRVAVRESVLDKFEGHQQTYLAWFSFCLKGSFWSAS